MLGFVSRRLGTGVDIGVLDLSDLMCLMLAAGITSQEV